jgi:hypothetical protein
MAFAIEDYADIIIFLGIFVVSYLVARLIHVENYRIILYLDVLFVFALYFMGAVSIAVFVVAILILVLLLAPRFIRKEVE